VRPTGHGAWRAEVGGALLFAVDNAYSIGSATGGRPNQIYCYGGGTFGGNMAITGLFGCNAATPQGAAPSGGAAPAGGTGTAVGGYDTAANRNALIALVNNIRGALVSNGIMS
jgi:hypothetical protein